jgi:hypothetical protein
VYGAKKKTPKTSRSDPQRRGAVRWRHPKARRIIVARSGAGAGAGVTIAIAEHAVRIDRGCRLIGDADDVDPFSRLHGILKMATDPLAAKAIEDVEADAIGPRRIIGRGLPTQWM